MMSPKKHKLNQSIDSGLPQLSQKVCVTERSNELLPNTSLRNTHYKQSQLISPRPANFGNSGLGVHQPIVKTTTRLNASQVINPGSLKKPKHGNSLPPKRVNEPVKPKLRYDQSSTIVDAPNANFMYAQPVNRDSTIIYSKESNSQIQLAQ